MLSALKEASEADITNHPNFIFMREVKLYLNEFSQNMCLRKNTIDSIISNMNFDFDALGLECSEEDKRYLSQAAKYFAATIINLYSAICREFGYEEFMTQLRRIKVGITSDDEG